CCKHSTSTAWSLALTTFCPSRWTRDCWVRWPVPWLKLRSIQVLPACPTLPTTRCDRLSLVEVSLLAMGGGYVGWISLFTSTHHRSVEKEKRCPPYLLALTTTASTATNLAGGQWKRHPPIVVVKPSRTVG